MFVDEPFEPKILQQTFQDLSQLKTLKDPICIVGVSDLTDLGPHCVKYLIEELKAEKIVSYYYSDFEPICIVQEQDKTIELAKIEIYMVKNFQNTRDFIIITGIGLPRSPIGINFLSDKLAEFISSYNPHIIISISTIPISHSTQKSRIFLAQTSEKVINFFKIDEKNHQNKELGLQLFQKGVVIGTSGLIVTYAQSLYNIIGGIILAEANEYEKIDFTAIKAVLDLLDKVFNLKLSFRSYNSDLEDYSKKQPVDWDSNEEIMKDVRKRILS
ncbi:MAG TPA: PAC2 family protein [Candidatus Deferrimicrobium sp.]|nr:PAC2 family protein [Candidatus Deferrimicrobium sp.]